MENTEKPASTNAPITQSRDNWWIRLIRYPKRKVDERAAKKQKETPSDRAARITADATKWIAVFTFVSVAVSFFTFVILKSQLKEMHDGGVDTHTSAEAAKKAADVAAGQLELSERPWVDATITPAGPFTFKSGAAQGILKVEMRNSGHSPALHTSISGLGFAGNKGFQIEDYRRRNWGEVTRLTTIPGWGVDLFPNRDFPITDHFFISKQEIDYAISTGDLTPNFGVVICIGYDSILNASVYHTCYIFNLKRDSQGQTAPIQVGSDVDAKHLILEGSAISPITAD